MEDRKIIELLKRRMSQGLDELARRFGRRLYATARNILGSHEDAEESVNDTYLAVWNVIPPKEPDPLDGFVYKTGRNIALDRLKYNTAAKRDSRYDLCIDELAGCIPDAALEDRVDARELGRAINGFLAGLEVEERRLFLRRYWFGDEVKTLAGELGLRPNTVSVRLSRLRDRLREHLKKEGYWDE